MSCEYAIVNGQPDAESTRLNQLKACIQANFLLQNPVADVPCPIKLDPLPKVAVTTRLESTRLLAKVVACPLYYRESTAGYCGSVQTIDSSGTVSGLVSVSGPGPGSISGQVSSVVSVGTNYIIQARTYPSIAGIDQITVPVVGLSSDTYIARIRTAVINASSNNPVSTKVFFRTIGPNTSSSGAPLRVCPPPRTAQDSGVPYAPIPRCIPGSRVVG
jgi:hypothetical protein